VGYRSFAALRLLASDGTFPMAHTKQLTTFMATNMGE
jgi:hypothetical protein